MPDAAPADTMDESELRSPPEKSPDLLELLPRKSPDLLELLPRPEDPPEPTELSLPEEPPDLPADEAPDRLDDAMELNSPLSPLMPKLPDEPPERVPEPPERVPEPSESAETFEPSWGVPTKALPTGSSRNRDLAAGSRAPSRPGVNHELVSAPWSSVWGRVSLPESAAPLGVAECSAQPIAPGLKPGCG